MKKVILAAAAIAFVAPTATLAQDGTFNFPTFYPEFTQKADQTAPTVTKLNITTSNEAVVTVPTGADQRK